MAFCFPIALLPLCYPTPHVPEKGFQDLPAEIKLLIIEFLDRDTLTLSRLAACNRELYDMAMPTLYANVSLGAPTHYRIWPGLAWPADRRSLERFLLTMLRKPHLAILVKSLDLTDLHDLCIAHRQLSASHPKRKQLTIEPLCPEDHQMIVDAATKIPLGKIMGESLGQAIEPNPPRSDALVAVLLGYLPALERLEMPMESDDPPRDPTTTAWSLTERVLVSMAGMRPGGTSVVAGAQTLMLSKLTHLKVEIDGTFPSADIDWLMVFLQIPTLTHVFGTKWTNLPLWVRPAYGDCQRLVHLELRDCTFNGPNLRRLLKSANKLETFIYERGWTNKKGWVLKSAELSHALQYTSQTLTCLELSINRCARKVYEELYLQPLDLAGLRHLKKLRISAGYLVQTESKMEYFEGRFWRLYDQDGVLNSGRPLHELLPKSLEQLHIVQINDGLEFVLLCEKLSQSLYGRVVPILSEAHQFQHLKEIIIEAPFEDHGEHLFETLSKAANQAGVKLTTIDNSTDYVRSWITGESRVSCPNKKIDWGFDGKIQWAHPFTRRGAMNHDLH